MSSEYSSFWDLFDINWRPGGDYTIIDIPNIQDIQDILKKNKDAILKNVRKINNLSYKNYDENSYCSDLFFKLPIIDDLLVLLKESSNSIETQKKILLNYINLACLKLIFYPIVTKRNNKITENSEALKLLKSLNKNDNYYLHIFKMDNKKILKEYLNNITKAYIKNIKENLTIENLVGDVKYVVDKNNDKYMFEYDFIKLGGLKKDFSEIDDNTEIIDIREYFYFCINNNTDENDDLFKIDIKFLVNYLYKVKDGSYDNYPKQNKQILKPYYKIKNWVNSYSGIKDYNYMNDTKIASIVSKISLINKKFSINEKEYTFVEIQDDNDTNNENFDIDKYDTNIKNEILDFFYINNPLSETNDYDYYLFLDSISERQLNISPEVLPIGCLPLLYLGKATYHDEKYYFEKLSDEDSLKINHAFITPNYFYIKNPDISGGKRKRKTMRNKKIQRKRRTVKRAKMRRTRHRIRVNRRHSKKYKQ
uniref:Uncharacterized protein n=1 Tax=viral metagenome TaxID=1070528 RepID=A0A6C0EE38_9ZZZZ